MDKLTKGLLTVIVIGDIQKVTICDEHGFEFALVSSSKLYVEAR